MAYQLSDLQQEVLRQIKDSTFSSQLITDYFNATQSEVLGRRRYPFMEVRDTFILTEDSDDFTLVGLDIQVVDYLALTADDIGSEPVFIEHRQFMEGRAYYDVTTTGRPMSYTSYASILIFDRPADVEYAGTIHYLKKPTLLSGSTDVPSIPEEFKNILIYGAIAGVEEYRGNFDIASLYRRRVEGLAHDLRLRYGLRQSLRPRKNAPRSFRRAEG